jgi:hypothetical protein
MRLGNCVEDIRGRRSSGHGTNIFRYRHVSRLRVGGGQWCVLPLPGASRVIAERQYLSARTVDNHLSRIYENLGISGRADLAGAPDT